jgi:hypothetical protein
MLLNGYNFSASDYADSVASLLIWSERDKDLEQGAGRLNSGSRTCDQQSICCPLACAKAEKPEDRRGRSWNETQDLAGNRCLRLLLIPKIDHQVHLSRMPRWQRIEQQRGIAQYLRGFIYIFFVFFSVVSQ